jgi:hypothetical protein
MNPSPHSEVPLPVNYVFVDFENVHEIDLSVVGAKSVSFTLLLGAKQTRLDAALVEKLMAHAASSQLVRLSSSGKNALDFAIAYYLGRAAMADPTAYFHIVSKDTGFDPLIAHLRSRHIRACRHQDFTTLPFSAPPKKRPAETPKAPAPTKEDLPTRVLEHLRRNTKNRPKRMKTLERHLEAIIGRNGTKEDVTRLIQTLQSEGHIRIAEKGEVTYFL